MSDLKLFYRDLFSYAREQFPRLRRLPQHKDDCKVLSYIVTNLRAQDHRSIKNKIDELLDKYPAVKKDVAQLLGDYQDTLAGSNKLARQTSLCIEQEQTFVERNEALINPRELHLLPN